MVVPLSISVDDFIVSESVVLFTGKEANPINGITNNVVRIINLILRVNKKHVSNCNYR